MEEYLMEGSEYSSVLKEGAVISTRIESSMQWHENVIYRRYDSMIHISMINEYLNDTVSIGKEVYLKANDDYYEYDFKGTISDIRLCSPGYLVVQLQDASEIINTRAFRRYDIFLSSNIRIEEDTADFFSIVTNISLGGAAFISNRHFESGTGASIEINLPDNNAIHVNGKITRPYLNDEKITSYGFTFTGLDPENARLLSEFIQEEESKKIKNAII